MAIRSLGNSAAKYNAVWAQTGLGGINVQPYYGSGVWYGTRGVFGGGQNPSYQNTIDYITIGSTGDATDFGDLTVSRYLMPGASNGTRGIFMGGYKGGSPGNSNDMDYVTIATAGNAIDFGDLSSARDGGGGACDGLYAYCAGGNPGAFTAVIDYVNIEATSNGSDFGDLTVARYLTCGANDQTRACFAAGDSSTGGLAMDIIDYITMGSVPGDATDFGNLTNNRATPGGCSSSAGRGLWAGGYYDDSYNRTRAIDYVAIQTTGDAGDFGDLASGYDADQPAGCSDGSRGIFGGGYTGSATVTINYVTIASTADATDFGDLTQARNGAAAAAGT